MTWYAASVIIAIKKVGYIDGPFDVYENVILVEADNVNNACDIAKKYGKIEQDIDDGLTVDSVPAIREFIGIKKIINISNPSDIDMDLDNDPPTTGTEITYYRFEMDGDEVLRKFMGDEDVIIKYIE
jgi:hypothetical protein